MSALSAQLEAEFGRGFSRRNLFNMVRFAEVFPDPRIVQPLAAQLSWAHFSLIMRPLAPLSPVDQLRLVAELISRLGGELTREARSLLELEGLGREVWEGTDVDEYLRRERWSWNG